MAAAVEPQAAPDRPDPVLRYAVAAVEHLVALLDDDAGAAARANAGAALERARADLRADLRADRVSGGGAEHPAPLAMLARRAALTADEAELLALLVGTEQDELVQRLLVSLTQDRERHRVELWMLAHLFDDGPSLVGPGSGLGRAALVEVVPRGAFGRSALRVAPRLLWALWSDPTADPALPAALRLLTATVPDTAPGWDAVLVIGADRVRRRQAAMRALGAARCLVGPPPASEEGWSALVREATISGTAVLVESDAALPEEGRRWIEASRHLRWALSSRRGLGLEELPRRDWREVHAAGGDPSDEEWAFALGPDVERRHHLTADQLDRMRQAMVLTGGDPEAAYRRLTDARLDALAQHTVPRAGWDDLVLSPGRKGRLRDLVERYRRADVVYDEWGFRPGTSRGLVALFSGPSGTGKTMGAEVVAGELGLDMYRLDLSSVVSKYIGETEKNLDELFDAASIGNTVLFFDEADSLFGKRTEVSDAHDRYANVETSYLLQRLERYDGIVVLATNYEKNIDEAFLRRVHVRVDFPMPGEGERAELWRLCLGTRAPTTDDVDLPWLVEQFDLSGAAIRNAVVTAAFLAATAGEPIGMAHLVQGVARELQKVGRMVTRDRFGAWYDVAASSG